MARTDYYGIKTTDLTATSTAIRTVNNTSDLIAPENYAELISTMKSGADYQNALDQMVEETATGAIASFTDGANNIPCKEVVCHINPTETGTGEKSPSNPYVIGGFTECNATRTGKNLFNKNLVEAGKWLNISTGAEEPAGSTYSLTNYIFVKGNISYTMTTPNSSRRWFYDINKQPVTIINGDTFTPTKDGFIRITIFANVSLDSFQLEVGSTATAYKSYTANTYTVSFGQTVYGGELILHEGQNDKINKVLGIVDIGSLTWTKSSGENFFRSSDVTNFKTISSYYKPINMVCSIYNTGTTNSEPQTNNEITVSINSSRLLIRDDNYTTASSFKQSIQGIILIYELATPEEITLPTKTVIPTLLGANNIYHDCNGDADVTYRANGALYVQEHPIT